MTEQVKYRGMRSPCRNQMPHPPHLVSHYDTVSDGRGEHFCPGVTGNGIKIVERVLQKGNVRLFDVIEYTWAEDPKAFLTHELKDHILKFPFDWTYVYEYKTREFQTAFNYELAMRWATEKEMKHPKWGKLLKVFPQKAELRVRAEKVVF